jgi:hypothetical protein
VGGRKRLEGGPVTEGWGRPGTTGRTSTVGEGEPEAAGKGSKACLLDRLGGKTAPRIESESPFAVGQIRCEGSRRGDGEREVRDGLFFPVSGNSTAGPVVRRPRQDGSWKKRDPAPVRWDMLRALTETEGMYPKPRRGRQKNCRVIVWRMIARLIAHIKP